MNLKLVLSTAMIMSMSSLYAQNGAMSSSDLSSIRESYVEDVESKVLRNAIQSNKSFNALALNPDIANSIDHNFKYSIKKNSTVTNQQSSGRCWLFTSLNVLRPTVAEKYNLSKFNFSQNYSYFWDLFEKSNLFLQNIIETKDADMDDREVVHFFKSPLDDGGVWNHFYNVAVKYGVVPQEVMPETIHSNNTSSLTGVLKELLRQAGIRIRKASSDSQVATIKMDAMKDVYKVLALSLGEPPVKFDWKYVDKSGAVKVLKDCTPQKFFAGIAPADYAPDSYIMVMNDPTRPYYKIYDIKNYRNVEEGTNWVYLNLPNEDIKVAALKSIKNNEPMYASCDVGKQLNSTEGILAMGMYDVASLLGIKLDMDKQERILTRQSGSSHAMTLVACDTDDSDKPVKWQFENSWGTRGNNGYLTFTDEWFDNYLFRIVLRKDYLDAKAIKALKGKAEKLPVWDYMF